MKELNERLLGGEVWLPVVGYEGLYEISSFGRVVNSKRKSGGILYQAKVDGYAKVFLNKAGKRIGYFVHRLVLFAFTGAPPDDTQGSHLNGDRQDNRAENLVWESRKDNCSRREGHGRSQRGEKAPSAKLTNEKVAEIRRQYKKVRQIDLATQYGVHRATIQRIHSGRYWNV